MKLMCSTSKCGYSLFFKVNPSHTIGMFLYPLKTSQNRWFSNVFRRYKKRPIG